MKNIILYAAALLLSTALGSCHGHTHEEGHAHAHQHEGGTSEPQMLTAYSDSLEIFIEAGNMHAGEETFIIAHITQLGNFKPYDREQVTFTLSVSGSTAKAVAKREKPGIYRCHITPAKSGVGYLICDAKVAEGNNRATIPVTVCEAGGHSHDHSAETSHSHGSNMVTFPKEQSWKIDFATEAVAPRPINRVIKGVGKVTSAPENITTLIAATEGKVRYGNSVAAGASVRSGETLFTLETGDVADNNAAIKFAEAESRYNYTKGEYERKKELVKTRIVTLGDYQSAEAAYLQAKAVYENLKKNFNSGRMELKSPITGYISDIAVASGDYVAEGTPLATLQREGEVQLFCEVSVRHAEALRNVTDVNVELNDGTCLSLKQIKGRITGIGRSIQNDCNMIPLTVVAKELPGAVPGNIVDMYLIAPEEREGIVVPNTALVEEMGRHFVFVQHTPAMFEKRLVVPGVTDGLNTRIDDGIRSGERIVTKGAISLKLAQGTGTLDPHAGHVH